MTTPIPQQPVYVPAAPQQPKGFAVTSLCTGIVGLALAWVPFVGIILGIIATVFGGIAIRNANAGKTGGKGMAIAGLVTGVLAVALFATLLVIGLASAAGTYG